MHPAADVADPARRVEVLMQDAQLGFARLEMGEAEGGGESRALMAHAVHSMI